MVQISLYKSWSAFLFAASVLLFVAGMLCGFLGGGVLFGGMTVLAIILTALALISGIGATYLSQMSPEKPPEKALEFTDRLSELCELTGMAPSAFSGHTREELRDLAKQFLVPKALMVLQLQEQGAVADDGQEPVYRGALEEFKRRFNLFNVLGLTDSKGYGPYYDAARDIMDRIAAEDAAAEIPAGIVEEVS
jgi:hypothetical protein